MEIERKFLISKMPDLSGLKTREIIQGYLSVRPVVRVRKDNDDYYLTYKNGGGMAHQEENLLLDRESFLHLLEKCDGSRIEKTRYEFPLSDHLIAEIDIFHGAHEGLRFLEVEFPDIQTAENFIPPAWFGPEVTKDPRYHNSSLI